MHLMVGVTVTVKLIHQHHQECRFEEQQIMTPNTAMREAVESVIAPRPSQETMDIMKNKKHSENVFKVKMQKCLQLKKSKRGLD